MRPKNTPNDKDRRKRILDAAYQILLEDGLSAITARSIARRAEVQVGSVSYYFASMKDLLLMISERLTKDGLEILKQWAATCSTKTIINDVAHLIFQQTTTNRNWAMSSFELYVKGLRDNDFQNISSKNLAALRDVLARFVPYEEAWVLGALADGLILSSLMDREELSVEEIRQRLMLVHPSRIDATEAKSVPHLGRKDPPRLRRV